MFKSTQSNFDTLIKPGEFQVFLCASRAVFPASFAIHPWFVVTTPQGELFRFEVMHSDTFGGDQNGFLYKNILKPWRGVRRFLWEEVTTERRNKSVLLGKIEGSADSVAHRMGQFLIESFSTYPQAKQYSVFPGPNSNTYAQWILDQFPEADMKLPWNAFGKGYARNI